MTDDEELAAKAACYAGCYEQLYKQHVVAPPAEVFDAVRRPVRTRRRAGRGARQCLQLLLGEWYADDQPRMIPLRSGGTKKKTWPMRKGWVRLELRPDHTFVMEAGCGRRPKPGGRTRRRRSGSRRSKTTPACG